MSATAMDSPATTGYVSQLTSIFARCDDKRQAHERSRDVVSQMARDSSCLTEALERHLVSPGGLNRRHFPVVSFDVASNPYFEMVFNCWVPLPDHATDVSTKSIHHHGPLLLTTATVFGPGYEHWMLTRPRRIDDARDLYAMEVIDHGRHALHEVAYVDAYVAHVPLYPESLTVTVCLWSSSSPTTWRDQVKRLPALRRNAASLRRLAARAGLAKQFDLKVDDYKDYYPVDGGFVGIKDREEFPYTNNEDYLYSLFHIIQATGNEQLAASIAAALRRCKVDNPQLVKELLARLQRGDTIEGRLSEAHYGVPTANFTRDAIERALASQGAAV